MLQSVKLVCFDIVRL